MKKFLLSAGLVIAVTGICIASEGIFYSDTYINKFANCLPYSESYDIDIPTQDVNSPVVHMKSTETIVGVQAGKCATKSQVYSKDLKQDIITVNCTFTNEQRLALVEKMKKAKTDTQAAQDFQNTVADYVQNRPEICTIKNLLAD